MDFPGTVQGAEGILDKLSLAHTQGKLIDGHSPGLSGYGLNAYAAALVHTDHECGSVDAMLERLSRGLYVMLRQGSACQDLRTLLKGVTLQNSRHCIVCSDDRQPKTIFEQGHLEEHLRICVEEGLDPMTAIQMATLNPAECFRLYDRGGLAPGLRADAVVVQDLKTFEAQQVLIKGVLVAEKGRYLPPVRRFEGASIRRSFHVKDFSLEKLKLPLSGGAAHVIDLRPGGVVTGKGIAAVSRKASGEFAYDPRYDIVKIAVVERHRYTGNVAVGLIRGYGIRQGALALSIAHDSHNIIVVGPSDTDMACAVETLLEQSGGVVLVNRGAVLEQMPLPLGGLMSDQSGEWVRQKLDSIHEIAFTVLGISRQVDPLMTLCFMSLPVIPELKLTDKGLFDVTQFAFIPVDADPSLLV
jgi:adenine deaminase